MSVLLEIDPISPVVKPGRSVLNVLPFFACDVLFVFFQRNPNRGNVRFSFNAGVEVAESLFTA
jgi:hypothetical protein